MSPVGRIHVTHPEQLGDSEVRRRSVSRVSSGTSDQAPAAMASTRACARVRTAIRPLTGVFLVGVTGVVAFGVGTLATASGSMTRVMRGLVATGLESGFERP